MSSFDSLVRLCWTGSFNIRPWSPIFMVLNGTLFTVLWTRPKAFIFWAGLFTQVTDSAWCHPQLREEPLPPFWGQSQQFPSWILLVRPCPSLLLASAHSPQHRLAVWEFLQSDQGISFMFTAQGIWEHLQMKINKSICKQSLKLIFDQTGEMVQQTKVLA